MTFFAVCFSSPYLGAQIVVASGLSSIYLATGDSSLLTEAQVSIDATIEYMESNGILKESCDDASGAAECDADQVSKFVIHSFITR